MAGQHTWTRRDVLRASAQAMLALSSPLLIPPMRLLAGSTSETASNLEDNAGAWRVAVDPPTRSIAAPAKENITDPSLDGNALRLGPRGGDGYTSPHYYRPILSRSGVQPSQARGFELSLSYWFSDTTIAWRHWDSASPRDQHPP